MTFAIFRNFRNFSQFFAIFRTKNLRPKFFIATDEGPKSVTPKTENFQISQNIEKGIFLESAFSPEHKNTIFIPKPPKEPTETENLCQFDPRKIFLSSPALWFSLKTTSQFFAIFFAIFRNFSQFFAIFWGRVRSQSPPAKN